MLEKEKYFKINTALRTAREEKGWSQKQVATLVGTSAFTVCRWERGLAFPSPHYRQQLCTIFDKRPQELGLMAQQKLQTLSDEETEATPLPPEKVWLGAATLPPRFSESRLIGREELIKQTQKRLRMKKDAAFCGLPGIGKTALALELVYREEVRTQFPDGILWARLGQKPNLQRLLSAWGRMLGLTDPEIASFESVLALGQTLMALIGDRRFLLILDDVWDLNDALACKIGGWQCSHLLTTRLPLLAVQFAHEGALKIPPWKPAEGLELLTQLTPDILTQERSLVETLVRAIGGLPLALTLILAGMLGDTIWFCFLTILASLTYTPGNPYTFPGAFFLALAYSTALRFIWQFYFYLETDIYYVITNAFRCVDLQQTTKQYLLNRLYRPLRLSKKIRDEEVWHPRDRQVARWYVFVFCAGYAFSLGTFFLVGIPTAYRIFSGVFTRLIIQRSLNAGFWDSGTFLFLNGLQFAVIAVLFLREYRESRKKKRVAQTVERDVA